MKIKRKILNKIFIIMLVIILIMCFFPNKTSAYSYKDYAGGSLFEIIFSFLDYIGDIVMNTLQRNFISPQPVLKTASAESQGNWNWFAFFGVVIGIIAMVVGICMTGGALAAIGTAAASVIIKGVTVGTFVFLTAGTATLVVGNDLSEGLKGEFDIPMMSYTPYTIFSGQVPAFDVNFIDPMDDIIITRNRIESNWEGRSYTNLLRLKDNENAPQPIYTYGGYGEIFASSNGRANSHPDTYSSLENAGLAGAMDAATANAMNLYGFEESDKLEVSDENKTWSGNESGTIYVYRVRKVYLKRSTNEVLMEYEYFVSGGGFYSLSGYVSVWDLSNVEESEVVSVAKYESSARILQNSISTWYKVLRRVALVVLLSMLIFVGIKMILASVAEEKAKYKKFFIDWLIAICLLFILHYIMLFILTISENLTKIFVPRSATTIECTLPEDTTVDGVVLKNEFVPKADEGENIKIGKDGQVTWVGDFVGYVRLKAGLNTKWDQVSYSLIYLVLVVDTCIFTVMYIKRVLYMAFFTMIAPLIAVTYPLDKIKDGQAQAFSLWFKEFIFNALIQPVHLIIYTITISTVMDMLVTKYSVYALVALGFIMPAEKFLRKMFGFEKAGTLSAMGQMAGGAMLYSGVQKLAGLGKKKDKDKDKEKDKPVRTADKKGIKLPEAGKSDKGTGVGIGEKSNGGTGVGEKVHPKVDRNQHTAQTAIPKANLATNSKHSVKRGLQKMGMRAGKKVIKAKPVKKLGRFAGKVAGAAALGSVGAIAGISSGDFDKTLSYTAGAATVGAKVGGNLSDNIWDEAGNIRKDFTKGYLGEAEYNNRELNKEFYMSDDWIDILNDNGIYSDLKGRDRERAIRETTQEYLDSGIDDPKKIQEGMKCGLSTEEAIYAIKLAESIGKDDWNDPDKRAAFQAKYQSALGDNANEIWKNIDRFV